MSPAGFNDVNPLVVQLFRHAVYVNAAYWILAIGLVGLLLAAVLRRLPQFNLSSGGLSEPRNRTYLRLGFGLIWLIDGILQFQPAMPLGLGSNVVAPMAQGTPSWLHALISAGVGVWNNHPIALAVGTAWIQVGIGILLLVSNNLFSRLAGGVAAGWAALIWLIGNGAGGIFQSTSSVLFGWPGATLFYVVAGLWLALPLRFFPDVMSRWTTKMLAVILALGAVLQALPDRGFWHGGNENALTAMTQSMTQTPQPHPIAWFAKQVGVIAGSMGGGSNILIILWLAVTAMGLWLAFARSWHWPSVTLAVGALLFWFSAQDAAIFGGLATDLNSLVPLAVLGLVASPRFAQASPVARRLPKEMRSSTGAVLAAFASAMVIFSVVSMGIASFSGAESTLYQAVNGNAIATNTKAPAIALTDQFERPYVLGEHPGRVTILTFLDPECWTDCPLLAQQLRQVRLDVGPAAKVDIVAVAADPYHETLANVNSFIRKHDLANVANFYFVTGKLPAVRQVWNAYGINVTMKPTDKMSIHSDYVFLISGSGRLRWVLPDNPLASWSGEYSAVAQMLTSLHDMGVH